MNNKKITRTINKSDWSGKNVTYKHTKNKVYLHGYVFNIKWIGKKKDIAEVYMENETKNPTFTIYKINANEWMSSEMGVERESKNVYDVIAMMVCNLV